MNLVIQARMIEDLTGSYIGAVRLALDACKEKDVHAARYWQGQLAGQVETFRALSTYGIRLKGETWEDSYQRIGRADKLRFMVADAIASAFFPKK